MLFLLFFLKILLCDEVCEKFLIHHNLDNCVPGEGGGGPSRRGPPIFNCPNQGTWSCSNFTCVPILDGEFACDSGIIDNGACSHLKDVYYIDFWIKPVDEWFVAFFHMLLAGVEQNTLVLNGELYEGLYDFEDKETFVSIVLDYCDDGKVNISVYINGSLTLVGYQEDPIRPYESPILVFLGGPDPNIYIYFLSAHTVAPTPEEIMWLYTLGKNRSSDIEICYECPCCGGGIGGVSSGYKTATIVLAIILGIFVLGNIILILWNILKGLFQTQPESFAKLNDDIELGENVFF